MRELSNEQVEYAVNCLKKVVESRDLSQTQLENLSGVNQSMISKVFSRGTDPSFEVLRKLYQAVGLKLSDVLYEAEDLIQDLCGYLATPLTGVVRDARAEAELRDVVSRIREVATSFVDPGIELYWPGDHTHPVRNANFTPDQVYLIDRSRASTHDFIVLFCAAPSYGVGQENEIATQSGLPAIRLAPHGISRMMSGSFINAIDVNYAGSLEMGITFDHDSLKSAFEAIRRSYFRHRALYKNLNGNTFGQRIQKLINERAGEYRLLADELGISPSYLHTLMKEQFLVSNPSARLLKRMAARLGTTVAFLIGESEETDPVWVESNASWRRWVDSTPDLDAATALAMRDEWRHDYRLNRTQQSTTSFRKSNRALREADWDRRYQQRKSMKHAGAGDASGAGAKVRKGDAGATRPMF